MLYGQVNASRLRRNVRAADESGGEASPRISVVENAAGMSTEAQSVPALKACNASTMRPSPSISFSRKSTQ